MVQVIVDGTNVYFIDTSMGGRRTTIDGLKLDKAGVEKEFPDLIGNNNWRPEAIKRFKEKIQSFDNEDDRANYILEDLKIYGYKPKYRQKGGFRVERIS